MAQLPEGVQDALGHVLFVPLAASLVVFTRLTLGIRVLGPFRSILLAIAFQVTGIELGVVFLCLTVGVMAALRPLLREHKLAYYPRVTVMLSAAAMLIIAALLISRWLNWSSWHAVAYFPVVVLCLIGDAFAKTTVKEGLFSALWRGAFTLLVAVLLTFLSATPGLKSIMLEHPELMLPQTGVIVLIARWMDWRLLEWLNPVLREDEDEFDHSAASVLAP